MSSIFLSKAEGSKPSHDDDVHPFEVDDIDINKTSFARLN